MAVNAYHRPSALQQYKPIPFQQIAYTGEKLRGASNRAVDAAGKIQLAEADVESQDVERRNQILDEYDAQTNEVYDLYKSDPYSAERKAQQIGMDLNRDMTRGELSTQMANRKAAVANRAQIDKLYTEGKLSADRAKQLKGLARSNYKGTGEQNEDGLYNTYQDLNPAFLETSIQDQAIDVIKGWKPNQTVGGLTKTDKGYLNRTTNEYVDEGEVYNYVGQYLREQPNNRAFTNQEAALNMMGQNIENPEAYREAYINDIYNKASEVAAAKAGYHKKSVSDKKDIIAAEARKLAKEDAPEPDAHINTPAREVKFENAVPEEFRQTFDADGNIDLTPGLPPTLDISKSGNISKESIAKYEQEKAVWDKKRETTAKQAKETLVERASDFGVPTTTMSADGKVIQRPLEEVQKDIQNLYVDYSTRGIQARIIQDPILAKRAGSTLANALPLQMNSIKLTSPGTLIPQEGITNFNKMTDEVADIWGTPNAADEAEFMGLLQAELRTNGVAGTTPKGEPYFNMGGRTFIASPTEEVKLYTEPYDEMLTLMDSHKDGVYTDPKTGVNFAYNADALDGKFSDRIRVSLPDNPNEVIDKDPVTGEYLTMGWLAAQTEEKLEAKNLIKTLKKTSSPYYSDLAE